MVSNQSLGTAVLTLTTDNQPLVAGLNRAQQQAVRTLESISRDARVAGFALSAAITAPIIGIGIASYKSASDFATAMSYVDKTISPTQMQLAHLAETFKNLSLETNLSATEIANIAGRAGELGIGVDQIESFTKTIVDLQAAVPTLDLSTATTQLARFIGLMKVAPADINRVTGSLVQLGLKGGPADTTQILAIATRLAPSARLLGLTAQQTLGISNALGAVTSQSEAAGTAFQRFIIQMLTSVSSGDDALNDFVRLAQMPKDAFVELARSHPDQAIVAVLTGLRDAGPAASTFLKNMDLATQRSATAILGSAENIGNFTASIKMAETESDEFAKAAAKTYATPAARLKQFGNEVQNAAINIGAALIPAVQEVANDLGPLVTLIAQIAGGFRSWPAIFKFAAFGVVGLAAAFGPLAYVTGIITSLAAGAQRLIGVLASGSLSGGISSATISAQAAAQYVATAATNARNAALARGVPLIVAEADAATAAALAEAELAAATTSATTATVAQTSASTGAKAAALGLAGAFSPVGWLLIGATILGVVGSILLLKNATQEATRAAEAQKQTQKDISAIMENNNRASLESTLGSQQQYLAGLQNQRQHLEGQITLPGPLGQIFNDPAQKSLDDVNNKITATTTLIDALKDRLSGIGTQTKASADEAKASLAGLTASTKDLTVAQLLNKIVQDFMNGDLGDEADASKTAEDAAARLTTQIERLTKAEAFRLLVLKALNPAVTQSFADLEQQVADLTDTLGLNGGKNPYGGTPQLSPEQEAQKAFAENRQKQLGEAATSNIAGFNVLQTLLNRIGTSGVSSVQKLKDSYELLDTFWTTEAIPTLESLGVTAVTTFRDQFEQAAKAYAAADAAGKAAFVAQSLIAQGFNTVASAMSNVNKEQLAQISAAQKGEKSLKDITDALLGVADQKDTVGSFLDFIIGRKESLALSVASPRGPLTTTGSTTGVTIQNMVLNPGVTKDDIAQGTNMVAEGVRRAALP